MSNSSSVRYSNSFLGSAIELTQTFSALLTVKPEQNISGLSMRHTVCPC